MKRVFEAACAFKGDLDRENPRFDGWVDTVVAGSGLPRWRVVAWCTQILRQDGAGDVLIPLPVMTSDATEASARGGTGEARQKPAGGAPLFDAFAILKENEWQGCDQGVCCDACGAVRRKPPLSHAADCWLNEALTWLERACETERARNRFFLGSAVPRVITVTAAEDTEIEEADDS